MLPNALAAVGSKSLLQNPLGGQKIPVGAARAQLQCCLHTHTYLAAKIQFCASTTHTGLSASHWADAVYYHPTLNPMGIPPPGKPQK